jgi:hypothetical protein
MHPETKHGSVEGKPRDDTEGGANFIFTFSDAMG